MARGILSEYGPDADKPQAARATCGGVEKARDVMNYKPPSIPGWDPFGSIGPGIGGSSSVCGSQGPKPSRGDGAGGSVGLGGDKMRKGSQKG